MRTVQKAFQVLAFTSLGTCFFACGGGDNDEGTVGIKSPFRPVFANTTFEYSADVLGTNTPIVVTTEGTKDVNGKTYPEIHIETGPDQGGLLEIDSYLDFEPGDDDATLGGGKAHVSILNLDVESEFKTPYTFKLNPPEGEPQKFDFQEQVKIAGSEKPVSGNATLTLVSKDQPVKTEIGHLTGCDRFTGEVHFDDSPIPLITDVKGDGWFHRDLGLVKVDIESPKVSLDLTRITEINDPSNKTGLAARQQIVHPGEEFALSTYEVENQTFSVDMNQHSKLYVEMRYADPELAKQGDQPPADITMGPTMGYFPTSWIETDVSLLHPEDNDQGMKVWAAFADEAAKGRTSPGAVRIIVPVNSSAKGPVLVTARILYPRYLDPQDLRDN